MESGQYADVRERCLPGNDWFVTRMIAIACICATLAASPYGCSWPGRPCQDPTIVAVVPAQGNPWWLSYECYWKCSDINVSPEGLLTLGDWDPFPESMHVAPAPEAMIAVAPHREGPFGAKGFGEGVLVAVAPAIANAIYNATGVRIKDLPITKERMLQGLKRLVER